MNTIAMIIGYTVLAGYGTRTLMYLHDKYINGNKIARW